jgi:hypothetical protein
MPIPLDLYAEITTADNTRYRWDANQAPGSRPRNLSFRSKIGEGFSDASLQLARRIDLDYPDLNLGDTVTLSAADGTVVYEGRVEAMPRDLSDSHSIGVTLAGWMAHAKDRKFSEIYVDRDTSVWQSPPLNERARLITGGIDIASLSFSQDNGGLVCSFPNQALGTLVIGETWYIAPPGCTIAKIGYQAKDVSLPAGWQAPTFISADSDGNAGAITTSATFDDTLRLATPASAKRYVYAWVYSAGTSATPVPGAYRRLSKIAMYGNHGLTLRTGDTTEPDGVYASDVIRDIATRFCPQLDTSGVQDTSYVIQHCAFRDRTNPYDAWLELNKYHLWHLGVWEGKRLDFRPYDLTDYDWEIRTDDPGTTFSPQGPSTDSLFNGIAVTYTDLLTGTVNVLTPETNTELADSSTENPWNAHGINHWDEITLSTPTLTNQATQLGVAALADRNRPKTPGTITVRGYIRDRAGNWQPASKVRAGDTIGVTNFPNDEPRLIVEVDYNDEDKSAKLAIDKPFALLDAYLDRLGNAVNAKGLS